MLLCLNSIVKHLNCTHLKQHILFFHARVYNDESHHLPLFLHMRKNYYDNNQVFSQFLDNPSSFTINIGNTQQFFGKEIGFLTKTQTSHSRLRPFFIKCQTPETKPTQG